MKSAGKMSEIIREHFEKEADIFNKALFLLGIVAISLLIISPVFADEPVKEPVSVNHIVAKMKRELDLTQEQIDAVRLIVEEDMVKREDLRQSVQNQAAITDRSIIQSKIRQLDEDEGQKLSQVLTKDQMNKWEQKQNLKNAFNQDQVDNDQWKPEDEGHGMGAAF